MRLIRYYDNVKQAALKGLIRNYIRIVELCEESIVVMRKYIMIMIIL